MKHVLFFDTETTGKADFRAAPDDRHQPRLVTLAAILANSDAKPIAKVDLMVRPDGFEIPPEATAIHGITQTDAERFGFEITSVLCLFGDLVSMADILVAYNCEFDRLVVAGEYMREFQDLPWTEQLWHDPMKACTPICKLPGRYGDFKWPRLSEAYQHLFQRPLQDAHNALGDVSATAEIYFHLVATGRWL